MTAPNVNAQPRGCCSLRTLTEAQVTRARYVGRRRCGLRRIVRCRGVRRRAAGQAAGVRASRGCAGSRRAATRPCGGVRARHRRRLPGRRPGRPGAGDHRRRRVRPPARRLGCATMPDGDTRGLNAVLRQAAAEAHRRWPDAASGGALRRPAGPAPRDLDAALGGLVGARTARRSWPTPTARAPRSTPRRTTGFDPRFGVRLRAPPTPDAGAQALAGHWPSLRRDVDDADGPARRGRARGRGRDRPGAGRSRARLSAQDAQRAAPGAEAARAVELGVRTSWRSSSPAPSWRSSSWPGPSWPGPSSLRPSWPGPSWPAPSSRAPSWSAPSWRPTWPAPSSPGPSWPAPSWRPTWPAPSWPEPSSRGAFLAVLLAEDAALLAAAAAFLAGAAAFFAAGARELRQLLRTRDDVLEILAGGELRHRLLLGLDPVPGLRVANPAGLADALLERPESGDGDLLALHDLTGDGVEHGVESVRGLLAVPLEALCQRVDELRLVHCLPFQRTGWGRACCSTFTAR